MKKGFIIIAIVVVIALYILNKVNTARQLEFTIGIPKNVSLQGGNLSFLLPLKSQNVTSTSINVKSLDFDLYAADKFLGKALLAQSVSIVPNNFTVFNVSVSISFLDILAAAKGIVNLFKQGKISLTLDGLIYAEGFQVPYKQTFELDYKNVL